MTALIVQAAAGVPELTVGPLDGLASPVETGDPAVDGRIAITGDALTLLPLLTEPVRQGLTRLVVGSGLRIEDRRLTARWNPPLADSRLLEQTARELVALAGGLDASDVDPPTALLRIVSDDPCLGARRVAARHLLESFGGSQAAAAAARQVLSGPDPHNRVLAAERLGGPDGFTAAAEVLADPRVEHSARVRALHHISGADDVRRDQVLAQVVGASGTGTGPLLHAVLEVVASHGVRVAAEPIGRLLLDPGLDDFCLGALIEAARALGDPAVEPGVLAVLEINEDLRVPAIEALAAAGTIAAVAPLTEWSKGLFRDGDIKDAARAAIVAIQARVAGTPGALAVVEPEAPEGGLSLAQVDGGVTLVTE